MLMKITGKRLLFKLLGLIFSTAPVIFAILSYFPVWRREGSVEMLSGFTVLLLFISIVPIVKLIKRFFSSPSATSVWFLIFVLFFIASKIADQMVVVSLTGFLGNLIGAFFWRIGGCDGK